MFYNPSALDILRLFAGHSSDSPEYLLSIFTDYADAAIVVFEVNDVKQKIIPVSYWRISDQESNLVQAVLKIQDEISKDSVIHPLINADTLDSNSQPTSSFLSLLRMEDITPSVKGAFTPLVGLMWMRQEDSSGHLDMSQFSVSEKLRAELSRILTHKGEQPSVLVMAFLQGVVHSRRWTSGW